VVNFAVPEAGPLFFCSTAVAGRRPVQGPGTLTQRHAGVIKREAQRVESVWPRPFGPFGGLRNPRPQARPALRQHSPAGLLWKTTRHSHRSAWSDARWLNYWFDLAGAATNITTALTSSIAFLTFTDCNTGEW